MIVINDIPTSRLCALTCFVVLFYLTTAVPTRTSERYCSVTRTENRTETVTTQIPCNQTYTARCGWFSLSYCTFHRITFCPHKENRTKTYHITDIKCCDGFKLTRRKTCIPNDATEEEEEEEEKLVTTDAPDEDKGEEEVDGHHVTTNQPSFQGNNKKVAGGFVEINQSNETETYNTVDNSQTDHSKTHHSSGENGKKLTAGAFAGIVCGGVFVGSIVGLAAIRIRKKQRRKKLHAERAAANIEIQHLQGKTSSDA